MDEKSSVKLVEKVRVMKFDHDAVEPTLVEEVVQETVTEISLGEAMSMGFVPKENNVEGTATVKLSDE
jgi:hypothetical protein